MSETPTPGEYVIVNGHLPDCPYIRTLRADCQGECDCRDREGSGFYDLDNDGDDHD